MRSLFSLVLVLAVGACGTTESSSPEQSQLESALHTWGHGHSQYSFTWQQNCECTSEVTRPIRITVMNDMIKDAVYVDTQQAVSADVRSHLMTIDGVFAEVSQAIQDNAYDVTVSYDASAGYPASVSVDYDVNVADEEFALNISDLQ